MTRPPEGATLKRCCLECGAHLTVTGPRGQLPKFCSEAHRTAFNMRRRQRGATLYDLYMAHKWDRTRATARRVQRAMDRLISRWRDEDHRERAGRESWGPWGELLDNDPTLTMDWSGDRAPWTAGRGSSPPRPEITV